MSLTLDQYVITQIHRFPTLYGSTGSYEVSKMKVLDHFLNVIGNGIRDNEELSYAINDIDTSLSMKDIEKYIHNDLYYGYYKTETIGDGEFSIEIADSSSESIVVIGNEKDKHPDIKKWIEVGAYDFDPYPNFQEEYSTIYQCPQYLELDPSFISGAIEFYEYVIKWFEENESKYHSAFPCDTDKKTAQRTEDLSGFLKSYETKQEIYEAYGCEFNGDLEDFQIRLWNKEKTRIFSFIDQTINKLKNSLKN